MKPRQSVLHKTVTEFGEQQVTGLNLNIYQNISKNNVTKEEIAYYEQCFLLRQCFQLFLITSLKSIKILTEMCPKLSAADLLCVEKKSMNEYRVMFGLLS